MATERRKAVLTDTNLGLFSCKSEQVSRYPAWGEGPLLILVEFWNSTALHVNLFK
jgi:hypothetical protein